MPKQSMALVPRVGHQPLHQISCPNNVTHTEYTLQIINGGSLNTLHTQDPTLQWQMRCKECRKIVALFRKPT